MTNYHDLTRLFETATDVYYKIIQRESLRNATVEQWVRRDIGAPVLTLTWQAEDDIGRNVHLGVIDEPHEVLAEVEINAWQNIETHEIRGQKAQTIQQTIHEGTSTLRHIERYDQQWWLLSRELHAALRQAYAVVSRFTPEDLQEGSRRNLEEGDPGPIELEGWLGE